MWPPDQAAGLGAVPPAPSDTRYAWLDGLDWEDVDLLRYLADMRRAEAADGRNGGSGKLSPWPETWLPDLSWEDLFFVKTLAEARRTVKQNGRSEFGSTPSAPFSPAPASFGPAERQSEPPLLLRFQAYRALHPEKFGRGGAGAGSASRTSSAAGGVGQQRPAGELQRGPQDPSENPELAAYRRWPRPPLPSDNPEFGAYWRWREGSGIPEGQVRPAPIVPASPSGGDPANPWQVGWEWLTGQGTRHHEFREGDEFRELLKRHDHIDKVRSEIAGRLKKGNYEGSSSNYRLEGWEGVPKYVQDYSNVLTAGHTGNLAATFLGSYDLEYHVLDVNRQSGTATVLFYVSNVSNLASATHPPVLGYTPFWRENIEPRVNALTPSGPLSPVTQGFWWTETIRFK